MADATDTTPEEPTTTPDAAEVESLEDIDAEPTTAADEAVTLVRATADDLNRAITAAATRGGAVDKTEVERQTSRLQARSLHALVELAYAGLLTPPVATVEAFEFVGEQRSDESGSDDATAKDAKS